MTVTGVTNSPGLGSPPEPLPACPKPLKPDLSLEWKDLKIEIKVYGKDVEEQEFVELFPRVSNELLSSACIEERKEERRQARTGSRLAHTLTEHLDMDQEVNSRKPDFRDDDDEDGDDEPNPDPAHDTPDKSEEDRVSIKHLIHLPNGQKKCHVCGKVFTDQSRVKRHLMSHSGKKPFSCHLCGWGFYQKCNMDRHMASHTKEGEGEPCPHCNNWFTTKSVLSLHMRDAHNDRLLTKKEVEVTMNRMRRQMEEQRKKVEREKEERRIHERMKLQRQQREQHMALLRFHREQQQQQMKEKAAAVAQGVLGGVEKAFSFQQHNQEDMLRQMSRMKNLTCNLCGKTFVKKTNLKHHMMLHRGEKPWKCNICEWRFVQKCNLKKHMESHITGLFSCPVCDIRFSSKASSSTHLFRAHKGELPEGFMEMKDEEESEIPPPKLNDQDKPVTNNWWKQLDMNSSQPKPANSLQSNLQEALTGSNLKAALSGSKPKPGGIGSNLQAALTGSNLKAFRGSNLQAALSGSNLQAALSMPKKNMADMSQQVTQPMTCNKCGKMFLTKEHLEKHMLVHNAGVKPYACPVCGCRFHLLHNMKRHILTHEHQGDIEQGTAEGLIKAAESTATQTSSVGRPGPSGFLGKLSGGSLDIEGKVKCIVCMKWFSTAASLAAHMEVHDKEKPFSCSICGWRFKQHQNLKRHMHTHTGVKPYACDFCVKGYTDAYSLKMHVCRAHPEVASSLPSMQITPRPKQTEQVDDEGFNSMLNQMKRKEGGNNIKLEDLSFEELEVENDDSLTMEPDINLFTPEEEMVIDEDEEFEIQDEDPQKESLEIKRMSEKVSGQEKSKVESTDKDIQEIMDMEDDEEEEVEEIDQETEEIDQEVEEVDEIDQEVEEAEDISHEVVEDIVREDLNEIEIEENEEIEEDDLDEIEIDEEEIEELQEIQELDLNIKHQEEKSKEELKVDNAFNKLDKETVSAKEVSSSELEKNSENEMERCTEDALKDTLVKDSEIIEEFEEEEIKNYIRPEQEETNNIEAEKQEADEISPEVEDDSAKIDKSEKILSDASKSANSTDDSVKTDKSEKILADPSKSRNADNSEEADESEKMSADTDKSGKVETIPELDIDETFHDPILEQVSSARESLADEDEKSEIL